MGTNQSQNVRVFISYAREDTEAANRLYNDLKMVGLDPWLDTQSLLPGQKWKIAIKDAIKNSRYFIPLLSSNSVEKIGYVQKELKEALEVLDELEVLDKFPQSKVFVIPVRINDCEVNDEKVTELHRVDLFPDWKQGIEKILKSVSIDLGIDPIKLQKSSNQQSSIYKYSEWDQLLRAIHHKECCPFIGPEANIRWIPTNNNIAITWAEEHGYPFEDANQLPQVAQYLAILKDEKMYPKNYLASILSDIPTPNFSSSEYDDTVYMVLADLNLPIYITTNYDHLMEEALKSRGKDPKSEFFRWNPTIIEYSKSAEISFVSDDRRYEPSPANPLVFHLYGDMDYPESMVLTEQDYIDFMVNMNKLDKNSIILPSIVRSSFARSSKLFLGYVLDDMNSRIIFRSIFPTVGTRLSIAVMPSLSSTLATDKNVDLMKKYLASYTKNMFKLNLYWYDLFMFLHELRNRFDTFRKSHPR